MEGDLMRRWSWEIFVGLMFLGMGVGMVLGNTGAGTLIGMGLGFILASVIRIEGPKVEVKVRSWAFALISCLIGVSFILMGTFEIFFPRIHVERYLGGVMLILVGIGALLFGASVLKEKHVH